MKNKKHNTSLNIIMYTIIIAIVIVAIFMVVDNIQRNKLVFELKGDNPIEINVGEGFYDPGFTIHKGDTDLSDKVVLYDNINTNELGTYERTYTYEDKVLKRTIEVKKLKEFSLNGDSDIYILLNGKYDDPGAKAIYKDVDYSDNVKTYNTCNFSKQGTCRITYQSKELNRALERRVHISDFKEFFKLNFVQGDTTESVIVEVTIDNTKVSSYIAPDGTTYTDNTKYVITKNGEYSFTVIDKYNNKYDRKIKVEGIVKPLTGSCEANVKGKQTTIKVTANKEIVKYEYNGVKSTKNTHTFNKRYTTNNVTLVDKDNLSIKIKCNTTIEKYNSFGAYKYVIIIGADGVGAALTKVNATNFKKIFGNYAYKHDTKTEEVTISAQNWGSILTGVAYNTHGFTNSSIAKNSRTSSSNNKSIFYYVRNKYKDAKLVSIVHWEPINHGIIETDLNVKKQHGSTDADVTNKVLSYLNSNKPTLMYIHFDEADAAAHAHGGFSNEYYDKVKYIDDLLGKIYNKLSEKKMLDDTLLILVADHGETTGGHGGKTKEESSAVLAVRGHSVNKMNFDSDTRNRDVAAIVLYALGIDKPSHFVSKVPNNLFGEAR